MLIIQQFALMWFSDTRFKKLLGSMQCQACLPKCLKQAIIKCSYQANDSVEQSEIGPIRYENNKKYERCLEWK